MASQPASELATVNQHRSLNATPGLSVLKVPICAATERPITRIPRRSNIIGTLTREQRDAKIARWLDKRRRRTWTKKISYVCRKQVADKRVRVKGRFVSKSAAKKNEEN
jgi:hypothetical protein